MPPVTAPPPLYPVLDALAAVATLVLVAFFVRSWRRSGSSMHALTAFGFLLVAASFTTVTASVWDFAPHGRAWDAARLAGQTGGALVLFFAYASVRRDGTAQPLVVLGATVGAGALVFAVLLWLVPPLNRLPALTEALVIAHVTQSLAFTGCAVLAFRSYQRTPRADRLLVPAAFVAWAASKYTWVLIDVTGALMLMPFVFLWRFTAIGLVLAALLWPVAPAHGRDAHAA